MRKKPQDNYLHESFRDRVISRDDIDFIVELLRERDLQLELSDEEFQYESIEEILERRGTLPSSLEIQAQPNSEDTGSLDSLGVSLSQRWVSIHVYGHGIMRNVPFEIITRLRNTPARVPRWINPFTWFYLALVAVNLEIWSITIAGFVMPFVGHIVVVSIIAIWLMTVLYSKYAPGLSLLHKHEGFWHRNKDRIFLLLIGGVLGGLFTFLFGIISK